VQRKSVSQRNDEQSGQVSNKITFLPITERTSLRAFGTLVNCSSEVNRPFHRDKWMKQRVKLFLYSSIMKSKRALGELAVIL